MEEEEEEEGEEEEGSPQQCSRRGQCTGGQRTTVGRQAGPTLYQHTDVIYSTFDSSFLRKYPLLSGLKVLPLKFFQPQIGKAWPSLNSSFHLAAAAALGRDTCFQQLDCPLQDPTNRRQLIQIQMQIQIQIQMQIQIQIQMQIQMQIQIQIQMQIQMPFPRLRDTHGLPPIGGYSLGLSLVWIRFPFLTFWLGKFSSARFDFSSMGFYYTFTVRVSNLTELYSL